jgi:hypothetical protein
MRQNNEGIAVGGPCDGEELHYWKQVLPISELGAARPFSDAIARKATPSFGPGHYEFSNDKWIWLRG